MDRDVRDVVCTDWTIIRATSGVTIELSHMTSPPWKQGRLHKHSSKAQAHHSHRQGKERNPQRGRGEDNMHSGDRDRQEDRLNPGGQDPVAKHL